MNLVCPECKNDVNLSVYPNVVVEQVVECDKCGITLQIMKFAGEGVEADIVDEGK